MDLRYVIAISSTSWALIFYCLLWLLYDGELSLSLPMISGIAGSLISLLFIYSDSERTRLVESMLIPGVLSCSLTFLLWISVFGRHPYIRELPTMLLVCLSLAYLFKSVNRSDSESYTSSLIVSEVAIAFSVGWWFGREFEGKTRLIFTLALTIAILTRFLVGRLGHRFEAPSISHQDRWAFVLASLAFGLMAFKYDIERRTPWSELTYELHAASQKLLPLVLAWLFSSSLVLIYLSRFQKRNSSEDSS